MFEAETIHASILSSKYIGIFIIMFLNGSIGIPPSEISLLIFGILISESILEIKFTIFVSTLASITSSLLLYSIGLKYNHDKIGKSRLIKYISKEKIDTGLKLFNKHGAKLVLFGRFIPGVRSQISIPAGFYRMKMWKFLALSSTGFILWNSIFIYFGTHISNIITTKHLVDQITSIKIVILLIITLSALFLYMKRKK